MNSSNHPSSASPLARLTDCEEDHGAQGCSRGRRAGNERLSRLHLVIAHLVQRVHVRCGSALRHTSHSISYSTELRQFEVALVVREHGVYGIFVKEKEKVLKCSELLALLLALKQALHVPRVQCVIVVSHFIARLCCKRWWTN